MNDEGDVKKAVKKLLDKHVWFWWMPGANGFGMQGVSDFLALKDGQFLAIETKFGKNKPTALQDRFLMRVAENGGDSLLVYEDDLASLESYLKNHDERVLWQEEQFLKSIPTMGGMQ